MLPPDHPQRIELNNEVHARPSDRLPTPMRAVYVALMSPATAREAETAHIAELARRFQAAAPGSGVSHYSEDFGTFRLTWERHTEFARYLIVFPGPVDEPFVADPVGPLLRDWVAALPGQVMVATQIAVEAEDRARGDFDALATRYFAGYALVGGVVAGGAAEAFTDFRVHRDGFGRLLLRNRSMTERQTGRTLQRLLELDTYRLLALLALPIARDLAPAVTRNERDLAVITRELTTAGAAEEAGLLERLSRLEAEIDSSQSDHDFRFGAAAAYYELVMRRVSELREQRFEGLPSLQEFTARRLTPAMSTCRAVASRQQSLSERVARATQLLSTRIGVTREAQNQALLESMNQRGAMQLRLQGTVEGLSVAAITYYVIGLLAYACDGLVALGVDINPRAVVLGAIPVAVVAVAYGVRRVRRLVGA
jgi:uncharacterized membrane-anchored protein